MKKGFTLAEVLITLGIIGVVAALTIPTLVQRNTNETHVQQLKKVYATLMQAAETAMAENNSTDLFETPLGAARTPLALNGVYASVNKAAVKSFLNTYFKVAVDCDSTPAPCFANSYKALDGSDYNFINGGTFPSGDCVSLADGVAICLDRGMTPPAPGGWHDYVILYIDVNGPKGPNINGRDLFATHLYSDGKMGDSYVLSPAAAQNDFDFCQSGGYVGCFSKIVTDGWKMDY